MTVPSEIDMRPESFSPETLAEIKQFIEQHVSMVYMIPHHFGIKWDGDVAKINPNEEEYYDGDEPDCYYCEWCKTDLNGTDDLVVHVVRHLQTLGDEWK